MKVENRTAQVVENIQFQDEVVVGIEDSELGSLIESLTHIYTDPYEANLREYGCNALDATILAGSERAVEINLPTVLAPTLQIRDYGVGMTKEEFVTVFSKIGNSTKRNTNSQIGAFGIGSKSAFAIVSQFIVTSVKHGLKNTIIVSKNENRVPVLKFLDEVQTDEPSGTTVSMAVPDVNRMHKVAQTLFLGWKPGSILVDGKAVGGELWNEKVYTKYENGWVAKSNHFSPSWSDGYGNNLQLANHKAIAVLGPVRYNVSMDNIFDQNNADDVKYITSIKPLINRLVLNVEVGAVSVVRSRDSFLFDKRTKAHLRSLFKNLVNEVQSTYKDKAEEASTRKEARLLAAKLEQEAGFKLNLTWRGEVIPVADQFSDTLYDQVLGKGNYRFISKKGNSLWNLLWNAPRTSNQKMILVTDIEEKDSKWNTNQGWSIPEWRSVARQAYYEDLLDPHKTVVLILVKSTKDKLSPWVETFADEVISFPDLIARGTAVRRDRDRLARANRDKVVPATRESVTVKKLVQHRATNGFMYERSDVSSDKLTSEKIVYIASPKEAKTPEELAAKAAYEQFMLRRVPGMWEISANERAIYLVTAYLIANDYTFVLVPRAVNLDKFQASVPQAISWSKAVVLVKDEITNIDPYLEGYLNISDTSLSAIMKLNTADIVDEEIREFFDSLLDKQMRKFSVVHKLVTHTRFATKNPAPLYKEISSVVENLGADDKKDSKFIFPLLSCLSHDAKIDHVVDYINLLSTARKA